MAGQEFWAGHFAFAGGLKTVDDEAALTRKYGQFARGRLVGGASRATGWDGVGGSDGDGCTGDGRKAAGPALDTRWSYAFRAVRGSAEPRHAK